MRDLGEKRVFGACCECKAIGEWRYEIEKFLCGVCWFDWDFKQEGDESDGSEVDR